jgi:hypothetical protein
MEIVFRGRVDPRLREMAKPFVKASSSSRVIAAHGIVDKTFAEWLATCRGVIVALHASFEDIAFALLFDYIVVPSLESYREIAKIFPTARLRIAEDPHRAVLRCLSIRGKEIFEGQCSSSLREYWLRDRLEIPGKELDWKSRPSRFNVSFYAQNSFRARKVYGWEYVAAMVQSISSTYGEIYLDLFLEKTFIFEATSLAAMGVIPYQVPWVGISHHTFDNIHNPFGAERMMTEDWNESMKWCRGIVCLSEYLAEQYRKRYPDLKVLALRHPAPLYVPRWVGWNGDIVSVGHWYRRLFSLSRLRTTFPRKMLWKYDISFQVTPFDVRHPGLCRNNWIRYGFEYLRSTFFPIGEISSFDLLADRFSGPSRFVARELRKWLDAIEIVPHLDADDYERCLLRSVVFLDLCDCSASYTVVECVTRCIPIIVNRHPAVEEYLGPEYPLFYDDVESITITPDAIDNASQYLSSRDTLSYSIEIFLRRLQEEFL